MIKPEQTNVLNELAEECYKISSSKGFHNDYFTVQALLDRFFVKNEPIRTWFDATAQQAEIARMHSELSEWVEGIRHDNPPDNHLPKFSQSEVEAADAIIRILDTCKKYRYRIGEAVYAKMEYNRKRPPKHGKNS